MHQSFMSRQTPVAVMVPREHTREPKREQSGRRSKRRKRKLSSARYSNSRSSSAKSLKSTNSHKSLKANQTTRNLQYRLSQQPELRNKLGSEISIRKYLQNIVRIPARRVKNETQQQHDERNRYLWELTHGRFTTKTGKSSRLGGKLDQF